MDIDYYLCSSLVGYHAGMLVIKRLIIITNNYCKLLSVRLIKLREELSAPYTIRIAFLFKTSTFM